MSVPGQEGRCLIQPVLHTAVIPASRAYRTAA